MWMNYGHMGWGSGSGGLLGITPMALWWVLLIAGVVLVGKWLFNAGTGRQSDGVDGGRKILATLCAR